MGLVLVVGFVRVDGFVGVDGIVGVDGLVDCDFFGAVFLFLGCVFIEGVVLAWGLNAGVILG